MVTTTEVHNALPQPSGKQILYRNKMANIHFTKHNGKKTWNTTKWQIYFLPNIMAKKPGTQQNGKYTFYQT